MILGTVKELFRYPVKSMGGESLKELKFGTNGVPGDRAWAVRDEERGGIRGGKRFAELMGCSARYPAEPADEGSSPAEITLPSGEVLQTGDGDASDKISSAIGNPVTLWPLMPKEATDHYKRGAPMLDDMEAEMRRMFARLPDEPLPDLSVFPPELMEYESPLGTYFDAFPLMLMTQQSLDTMAETTPDHKWDVRRFRPNLLLDCATGDALPERAWENKKIKLGTAVLQLGVNCPRCIMTTHGFGDLPKDPGIMRSLVKNARGELGIYASVLEAGNICVGDRVELID